MASRGGAASHGSQCADADVGFAEASQDMNPDTENLPARYRLSADQCRRRADAAVDAVSKASWLRFAEEWMKLADEAELSAWRAPPK
jgi:hypothetical protein